MRLTTPAIVAGILLQVPLAAGTTLALQHIGHASETRPAYVTTWDSAGWQAEPGRTVFRTALDSRGQYAEVTCHVAHHALAHCQATADDGSHPGIPARMLTR